jgi:hypothetical protein
MKEDPSFAKEIKNVDDTLSAFERNVKYATRNLLDCKNLLLDLKTSSKMSGLGDKYPLLFFRKNS